MKMGSKGLDLVKSFEGLYTKAYKCPAGVWTIGYGHTGKVNGKSICAGMTISTGKATSLLAADMHNFENAVKECVKVPINQNQFDALVAFSFNVGAGALQSSTLLKYLNKKEYTEAANEFLKWNKGGGRVLNGLTRRREAERKLFLLPVKKKVTTYNFKRFVKDLEKLCNLKVDGEPDKSLLRVLPIIDNDNTRKSAIIIPLKKILKAKGYKIKNTNNIYDAELHSAVKEYKRAHSFPMINGTVGEDFWKKILKL